jgi:hypothetical protein
MSDSWYYSKGDEQFGPMPESELRGLADSGELQPTDMVWREGMSAWRQAGEFSALFPNADQRASSGPPPRKQSFDKRARETVDAVNKHSEEVSKKLWFFDLKFESFFTPKLIGFAFLAWMTIAAISLAASAVWALLTIPALQAAAAIIGEALTLLVMTIMVRVLLENTLVFFRVAEHLQHLKTIADAASRFRG